MNYEDGDTITLEHPNGSKFIGKVAASRWVELSGRYEIATLEFDGFVVTAVEKPEPQLPTIPGLYVPTNNAGILTSSFIYRLSGDWSILNDPTSSPEVTKQRALRALRSLGGLTRLVPENKV